MVIGISILIELVMLISESAAETSREEIITHSDVFLIAVRNPLSPQYSYQDYLVREAIVLGINPNLAVRIVLCESNFRPNAQNSVSSAYGIFQFLNSSWKRVQKDMDRELNRHDPYDQIDAGLFWLSTVGTGPWNASKSCWS